VCGEPRHATAGEGAAHRACASGRGAQAALARQLHRAVLVGEQRGGDVWDVRHGGHPATAQRRGWATPTARLACYIHQVSCGSLDVLFEKLYVLKYNSSGRTQQEQQLFFFFSHYEPPSIVNDECLVTGAGSAVRTNILV